MLQAFFGAVAFWNCSEAVPAVALQPPPLPVESPAQCVVGEQSMSRACGPLQPKLEALFVVLDPARKGQVAVARAAHWCFLAQLAERFSQIWAL